MPAMAHQPLGAAAVAVTPSQPSWLTRFSGLVGSLPRPQRISVALLMIWTIAALDLSFTLQESVKGYFYELNPVAAKFLDHSLEAVVAYKFTLLIIATAILAALRHHPVTETAAWFSAAASVKLALHWYIYFQTAPAEFPSYFPPLLAAQ